MICDMPDRGPKYDIVYGLFECDATPPDRPTSVCLKSTYMYNTNYVHTLFLETINFTCKSRLNCN